MDNPVLQHRPGKWIPIPCLTIVCATLVAGGTDWHPGPGYRSIDLPVAKSGKTGFTTLGSADTAITFSNIVPESVHLTNHIFLDGSGVAAGDVDGDGLCDLYFCGIYGRNSLYRNLGNFRFEDITERAGVACADLRSTGAMFVDLDGDGHLDLVVNTTGNGTLIFYNDGKGHFRQASPILNPGKGGKSLAAADVDGRGYLDLYIANNRVSSLLDMPNARATFKMVNGKQTVATFNGRPVTDPDLVDRFTIGSKGDFQENGEPDVLYRNLGGTNFAPVSFTDGSFLDEDGQPLAKAPLDWGLSAMFRDINGDGLPDLYVCNDFQSPDRFWINQGGGKFRLLPRVAQRKSSMSAMAVDFADINRDGYDDFLVLEMMSREHVERMCFLSMPSDQSSVDRPQYELNTLFLNRGDTTFAEIAQLCGLEATEWAWSGIFLDVDLDGWEDLLVVNGIERTGRDPDVAAYLNQLRRRQLSDAEVFEARRRFPKQANGNLAFRNRGDLTFEEVSKAWGFDRKGTTTTMALADLDNDGDLDVVLNPLNGPALICRNESPAPRIAVRLKGMPPNTCGIGSRIGVAGGPVPFQTQEMICGGRYLSCDDTIRTFAAGTATNLTIEVAWRSGRHSLITNTTPNRLYEIDESQAEKLPPGAAQHLFGAFLHPARTNQSVLPLFEDMSDRLRHVHHDKPFPDFALQPLLPNKLSQLGPGVAWVDIDGDGREDLVIGGGGAGQIGIYLNRGAEGFQRVEAPAFGELLKRDQTGIVGWHPGTNRTTLLVGCANYEDGEANGPGIRQYDLTRQTVDDSLTTEQSSTGPLALADLTGTGKLELFAGGRVIPGGYPFAASSRLLERVGGKWQTDVENTKLLNEVGLVSGAVFSDLDGDGLPELVLASDWGSIRIFRNQHGKLTAWDPPLTWPSTKSNEPRPQRLSQLTGWWNSVTAGDFDNDGRMDLVAGNWGRNTKYQSLRSRPLLLYYGDLAGDGTVQILEAHYEPPLRKTVPLRQLGDLAKGLPFLTGRFASNKAYSTASVEEVLGDRFSVAKKLEAVCLESVILLNRGDHFEVRLLPIEAQMSPVFGICAGDFNGDGNEDLFLAQNFFAVQPETPRCDAGRGLLLEGDGSGGFTAVPGQESGIKVYGEQRGAAAADFDGDGRLDLAVTQNSAETVLYRNANARPGLRVRLRGPEGNTDGYGAVIRLKFGDRLGPAREVHGGSGYWSQDGVVQVLGGPGPPSEVVVRWPGGKVTTNAMPSQAREIRVSVDGHLEVLK
ncbi:MAG TPA: FG-GAP-like repeat-containing protein [Candidatus Limnocylindrales bacterium]|nr:FG-GAP-like repeat-containing protein [Candidatus Limnocylindrales bacterium]